MSNYKIADLNIKINHTFPYVARLCRDYLNPDQNEKIDFEVSPIQEDLNKDMKALPDKPEFYFESLSIYRQIARKILEYNGIVMHASVIEAGGKAYAFTAPSGTGKSTHTRLWTENFDDAVIINGDKPLLRYIDDKLYVYGSPWCGKENYNVNSKAELCAICFIERAEQNSITEIDTNTALRKIFTQLLLPENKEQTDMFFNMVDILTQKVKFYSLKCNMENEAAIIARNGMENNA